MIINRKRLLSYRCPYCGSMQHQLYSIFDFQGGRPVSRVCNCKRSAVSAYKDAAKNYFFEIPCILCGGMHSFKITKSNLWTKSINSVFCDKTNTEIAFLGEQAKVIKKVGSIEKEIDDLITKLGYNDCFSNIRIMLEVLNRIHDMAEEGNLICECGSSNVELTLLSDRVKVSCRDCSTYIFVSAKSNQDLINLYSSRGLVIYKQTYKKLRRQ